MVAVHSQSSASASSLNPLPEYDHVHFHFDILLNTTYIFIDNWRRIEIVQPANFTRVFH